MLLEFYGKECPHCERMRPLVERLQSETGVSVQRYEIWHNQENAAMMKEYDTNLCGGVPFFFNTESKEFLCGEASYDQLKVWAGKK